ncbi:MAG TPA: GGDEF domain-containing protein, partial [Candidatus Tenderia sp.]|nr:GGDEF domain-containing protein [Candidatus Tenderia sp.]
NRSLFKDRMLREIEVSKRQRTRFALLFIDLDRFKAVNDTLGHNVGDKLLQAVASRIKQCVRESDTVARLGGDEFTVILANVHAEPGVSMVAENIIDSLQDPFDIDGQLVQVGASIGVAIYPDNGADYSTLLKSADAAMYQAKNEGRGRCRFFAGALESGESH